MKLLERLEQIFEKNEDQVIAIRKSKGGESAHGFVKHVIEAVRNTANKEIPKKEYNYFNGSEEVVDEEEFYYAIDILVEGV